MLDDPANAADQLRAYVAGFSKDVRDIFEKFDLEAQIMRLDGANLLYLVLGKFVDIDLGPENVSNTEMGYFYEELVRRFSELSNETAGEHFMPREVVELMVNLLFIEDDDLLARPGTVKTMLDLACGTGGMLSVSEQYLRERNPDARLEVFGQELNPETYAVCRSDTCCSRIPSTRRTSSWATPSRRTITSAASTTSWRIRLSGWSGRRCAARWRPSTSGRASPGAPGPGRRA